MAGVVDEWLESFRLTHPLPPGAAYIHSLPQNSASVARDPSTEILVFSLIQLRLVTVRMISLELTS